MRLCLLEILEVGGGHHFGGKCNNCWELYILTQIAVGMFLNPVDAREVAVISKIFWLVAACFVVEVQGHGGRTVVGMDGFPIS